MRDCNVHHYVVAASRTTGVRALACIDLNYREQQVCLRTQPGTLATQILRAAMVHLRAAMVHHKPGMALLRGLKGYPKAPMATPKDHSRYASSESLTCQGL